MKGQPQALEVWLDGELDAARRVRGQSSPLGPSEADLFRKAAQALRLAPAPPHKLLLTWGGKPVLGSGRYGAPKVCGHP